MTARDSLEDAFTWRVERTLSQALTLQYDKVMFILDPTEEAQAAIGKRVTVVDYPDGRLAIRYGGADLPYRTFDKIRHVKQAAVVDNKRLGPLLAMIHQNQQLQKPERRSGPRRRDQAGHMFDVGAQIHVDRHGPRRGRRAGSALCRGSAPARRPTASSHG